jgi:DNA-binding MarR family transcriptional regulator
MSGIDDSLRTTDDALVRLRRLWSASHTRPMAAENPPVEMSSVLVVEACARAAARGRQATVGDVADFADVEHSTASRLIDRAARSGLVVRARSRTDARRTDVRLTGAGHALQQEASAFRLTWLARVLADWPAGDVATFAGLLSRFADQVGDTGPWSPQPPDAATDEPRDDRR